jgi:hypothetical protein
VGLPAPLVMGCITIKIYHLDDEILNDATSAMANVLLHIRSIRSAEADGSDKLISSTHDDYGANKRNESIIAMVKSTIKGSLNKKLKE